MVQVLPEIEASFHESEDPKQILKSQRKRKGEVLTKSAQTRKTVAEEGYPAFQSYQNEGDLPALFSFRNMNDDPANDKYSSLDISDSKGDEESVEVVVTTK